eukprot:403333621
MNAVLQCILALDVIGDSIKKAAYDFEVTLTPFCNAYNKILFISEKNQLKSWILPQTLQKLVHQKFQPILQHDAHEFLIFFLTQLSEEIQKINKIKTSKDEDQQVQIRAAEDEAISEIEGDILLDDIEISIPNERMENLEEDCESSKELQTQQKWDSYKERNNSFIDHLFTGMFKSIVKCSKCKNKSCTYDPFMVLSIPALYSSINQSLEHFLKEENLSNYFCTKCKKETKSATLKVQIAKFPKILVIHLKRFQQYPFMKKIRGYQRYPLRIDISDYTHQKSYSKQQNFQSPDSFTDNQRKNENKKEIDNGNIYELSGIVVHWGTLEHGHYIAVVKKQQNGQNKWYYCNDRNVGECEEKLALSQEAYLLIYTQVKTSN